MALIMYQVSGKSSQGWRLLDIAKIEGLRVLDETFSGNRDKSSSELVLVNEMSTTH